MFAPTDTVTETKTKALNWFLNQGLGVIALTFFCYLLYKQQLQAQTRAELCNSQMLELYQKQADKLVDVLAAIQQKLPDAEPVPVKRKK